MKESQWSVAGEIDNEALALQVLRRVSDAGPKVQDQRVDLEAGTYLLLGLGSSPSCVIWCIYPWPLPLLNLHVLRVQNKMKNFRETKWVGWQKKDQILKEGWRPMEDSEPHLTATWRSVTSQGWAPCACEAMQEQRPDPIGNQWPSQMSQLQDRAESRAGRQAQWYR